MRPAGGLTGMADEGRGSELPQRVRDEARAATSGSGAPTAPVLSPRAPNAGPVAEDEVTEWLGAASDAEPESASWLGAALAALIVIPALVIGSLAVVAVRHFTATPQSSPVGAAPARHDAAIRGEA